MNVCPPVLRGVLPGPLPLAFEAALEAWVWLAELRCRDWVFVPCDALEDEELVLPDLFPELEMLAALVDCAPDDAPLPGEVPSVLGEPEELEGPLAGAADLGGGGMTGVVERRESSATGCHTLRPDAL